MHLGEVRDRLADFEKRGVQVVGLAMCEPAVLKQYLHESSWPFPIYCDPQRELYRALGLARTSWWRILSPGSIFRYLKLIFQGGRVRSMYPGEDPLQLGGDFLIRRDRGIIWSYRSQEPTDRPKLEDILMIAVES